MLDWYVMRSKSNKEELLYRQLCNRRIETYYPCIKVQPVNPRALKIKPYFPGYLFIKTDLEIVGISDLQWLPGSVGLVSFGGQFATISDDFLQALRQKLDQANAAESEPRETFRPGEAVSINSGPFAGYRAIFDTRLAGHERVRVLLQLLRDRQMSLELSAAHIERLD